MELYIFVFLEETIEKMLHDGVITIVTLPINPIYSQTGSGEFHDEVTSFVEGKSIKLI